MKKFKQRISRVLGGTNNGNDEKPTSTKQVEQPQHTNLSGGWKRSEWERNRDDPTTEQILMGFYKGQSEFFPGIEEANGLRHLGNGRDPQQIPAVDAVKSAAKNKYRWSLSDSLSQLGERIAEWTVEEEGPVRNGQMNGKCVPPANGTRDGGKHCTIVPEMSSSSTDAEKPLVLMRPKKRQRQQNGHTKSWHASRWFGNFGNSGNAPKLGSDGESEVSPSSSEPHSSSSCSASSSSHSRQYAMGHQHEYVPNVKMRQKANVRRWNEEEIQKRLSLPAYINIPQSVVEKLNRTGAPLAADENPLNSRKCRRASLSEIGFGKLETYKKIFDLGEGTYATVFLGQSLLTGRCVALKEIRLEHEEGAPCTAIREVSLLRNLKHANIVTLHDIVYTDRFWKISKISKFPLSILTLVFEFVEQDLREYMDELEGHISVDNVRLFLVQLLRGLAYCHARRILHRDLKPQNLLITSGGELKLADFGLARAQSFPIKTYSSEVVTLWYRPPDVLLGSTDYGTHIDMWAVGCILYEMLAHRPMFPGSTPNEQLGLIFQKLGTPTAYTHPELCKLQGFKKCRTMRQHQPKQLVGTTPRMTEERVDLMMRLLKYDGKQRISATQAMRHPFLQCFPEALFRLPDTDSIYTLPNVRFTPDKTHNVTKTKALSSLAELMTGMK